MKLYLSRRHLIVGKVHAEWGWYKANAWRLLWLELLASYDRGSFCVFDIEVLKFCVGVYVDRGYS